MSSEQWSYQMNELTPAETLAFIQPVIDLSKSTNSCHLKAEPCEQLNFLNTLVDQQKKHHPSPLFWIHLTSVCLYWLFDFSYLSCKGRIISRRISSLHWILLWVMLEERITIFLQIKISLFPSKRPILMLLRNTHEEVLWFWVSTYLLFAHCTVTVDTELNGILSQSVVLSCNYPIFLFSSVPLMNDVGLHP